MKKTSILLVLIFISINSVNSQIKVGLKQDINGIPFNGYYDPFVYSPSKKISKVHNSNSFEIGYYFDKSGKKISGLIKFQDNKIWFKKNKHGQSIKLKPDEIKRFEIGVDSFFAISKYYYKNILKTKPVYVQFISEFNGYTFVKYYNFKGMGNNVIEESYLVKSKDGDIWGDFNYKNKFEENALKYFGHIPYLKEKIKSEQYKNKDIFSMIKMAEYFEKFKNSKPILYDKYWQETNDNDKSEYSARITEKQDSIWTFDYYKGDKKLYSANYSSFFPNTKNGDFICYFPDEQIRQILKYEKNEVKEVKLFYENGTLKTHYKIAKRKSKYSTVKDVEVKYHIVVADSLGNNIIKNDIKKTSIQEFDEFINETYTNIYKNNKLFSSYRLVDSDTVFQITDKTFKYKMNSLKRRFSNFMSDKNYDKALSVNAQGTILISLVIDENGYAIENSRLNSIHPEIDKLVDKFIKNELSIEANMRFKFKPYKKGKIKKQYEFVVPIVFSVNRFYRTPPNYWWFHQNFLWNMHMQNMHQMHNIKINIPSGF